jgi:tRNA G18 (ribose-2'-O)-methylase SpoU
VPIVSIDASSDVRLDDYRNVPDADLLERHGIFVAEGRLVVRRLLTETALAVRSILVTPAACASLSDALAARPELTVYVVPQTVMDGVSGFNIHRGCLAIGERPVPVPWHDLAVAASTIVVLERVSNADNVGGIFRNAAAFGAGAVLLDPVSTDPLYRKAIRTSMGAGLIVPFARLEPWPDALRQLRGRGIVLVAMTPSSATPIRECAHALAGTRVAVVLGHEGDGLSTATLDLCDHRARIPIAPGVDSLNVSSAAAIALYELQRAR